MKYILLLILILTPKMAMSDFFKNITNLIENNTDRLSYGVSVADINKDNKFELFLWGQVNTSVVKISFNWCIELKKNSFSY